MRARLCLVGLVPEPVDDADGAVIANLRAAGKGVVVLCVYDRWAVFVALGVAAKTHAPGHRVAVYGLADGYRYLLGFRSQFPAMLDDIYIALDDTVLPIGR